MSKPSLTLSAVANEDLVKDLRSALTVAAEVLIELAPIVNTDRGFRLPDAAATLLAGKESTRKSVPNILQVLQYVFLHGVKTKKDIAALMEELREVCEANEIQGFEEREEALRAILDPAPGYAERRELRKWARGVFPNLVGIEANVELRAVFENTYSSKLKGYIPLAILRLAYDFYSDDSPTEYLSLQLGIEDVDKLISTLERTKERLSRLQPPSPEVKVYSDALLGLWPTEEDDE